MSPLLKKTLLQCYLVPVPQVLLLRREGELPKKTEVQALGQEGESNEWQ